MEIPSLPKYQVFEKKRFEAFIHDRCIRILL